MQRVLLPAALIAVLLFGARALGQSEGGRISDEQRAAAASFDPSVAPADRAWILAAIAKARPEAQRLIGEVDGVTTFRTSSGIGSGAIGITHSRTSAREVSFVIDLDIAELNGRRVIDRETVVLHELGHAVDIALVPDETIAALDAGIPRTGTCGSDAVGAYGSCTEPQERFADTFAKWALRGAVSAVGSGYGVGTPASLEDWGAPLATLSRTLP